jgi:hypothetical protein
MGNTVYIVHNIDTEGPLNESLSANFERIEEIFGHKIESTYKNLEDLQNCKVDLGGDEKKVQELLLGKRIQTHTTWHHIDKMLDVITSVEYRNQFPDSDGGGWIYNWFCMTHVGITGNNPRRRDMGYHNIYDHYKDYFDKNSDVNDMIQWHYHALSITNDAHRAGCTYLNSPHIHNILARSIIDRKWFPAAFRAGHNTERPDSHFFLEQWIPFDYSNASMGAELAVTSDSAARYGDWRGATTSWIPYHPNHDDYKKIGSCRRYIARCLSIDDRGYSINFEDVVSAFKEADNSEASILSFTNHDFRDMSVDLDRMRFFLEKASLVYPNVKFKYSNAVDAMRAVLKMDPPKPINFNISLEKHKTHTRLIVISENSIFGPQPYLAIKTKNNEYIWQNFDFENDNHWSYSFDINNLLIDDVSKIGIASNTDRGLTEILTLDPQTGEQQRVILNG